jgi:hypothetical protein
MKDLATLQRWLLALLAVGLAGTCAELVLIEHVESGWQLVPLVLIPAALVALGLVALRPSAPIVRTFRALMLLCAASGPVGIWRHYSGNAEFELEMYPTLGGLDLVRQAAQGATPLLAPATMLYLGLLGLAATWRHPALAKGADP